MTRHHSKATDLEVEPVRQVERLEELVRYLLVVKGANPDATRHH